MFGYSREAVRVKVKKCEGKLQPELRKFSVDPQITSLEVLQSILMKAFDIKSEFNITYRTLDDHGHEVFLPVLSDWDLDAAFLKAHNTSVSQRCEPCIQLRVDTKPFAEASDEWEPSGREEAVVSGPQDARTQSGLQGLFMNQVEKTFNMVSRALNLYEDPTVAPRAPLSDAEFRTFLDPVGQIVHVPRLKEVIYCGGIEPSLRKVVWKHILNVYPDGMNGKERMDYIKSKAAEYYSLRALWKDSIQKGQVNSELAYVTSMVRKDVLRTDRHHKFYAGSDDNQNIASLFNILTTYALHHPLVSYCQGMSDLASPLLVTMGDEAHAYICLCALMTRLHPNFLLDGEAMTIKFTHLTEALQVYDPEFYAYLKSQQADDLLFCYRWLLLEMKREFAFDDALRMLEVLWASLPQTSPIKDLVLKEQDFDPSVITEDGEPPPVSPLIKTPRENAYTKVCSIRRQSSAFSLTNVPVNTNNKLQSFKHNYSLDENATRNVTHMKHAKEFQSLDDAVLRLPKLIKENKFERTLTDQGEDVSETEDKLTEWPSNGNCLQTNEIQCLSSSTGNLVNGQVENNPNSDTTPLGCQIRKLRDKISVHNKIFNSTEKLNSIIENEKRPKAKMIKNLNEFLTLTANNKPSIPKPDKLMRTQSAVENNFVREPTPSMLVSKTSFDEADLLSVKVSRDQRLSRRMSKLLDTEGNDSSSPDDSEYYPMTTSMTRELRLELEHLDRQVFGPFYDKRAAGPTDSPSDSVTSTEEKATDCERQKTCKVDADITEITDTQTSARTSELSCRPIPNIHTVLKMDMKNVEEIFVWENPLLGEEITKGRDTNDPHTPDEQAELDFDCETGEIIDEMSGNKSITPIRLLRKSQPEDKHSVMHSTEPSTAEPAKLGHFEGTSRSHKFFSSMSQELENAKRSCETLLNPKQTPNLQSVATTINNFQKKYEILKPSYKNVNLIEAGSGDSCKYTVASLPPPSVFGGGNPFLMFLCLTVLLQHRDFIMRNQMDYNELAMHFDKMVRKHNVNRVLNQARQLYAMYLKQQASKISDVST